MWAESSWAFPESYTAGTCTRTMANNGETKGLHNHYTFVSLHVGDHEGVVGIFVALSCEQ